MYLIFGVTTENEMRLFLLSWSKGTHSVHLLQ